MKTVLILLLLAAATPVVAQDRPTGTENPLAQLKDEVQRVLGEASLPFTEDQEKAITLMMEDRRKASEDLFGGLMDFSAGPTRGQEADRLNSALDWMRGEFLGRLQDYLTPQQLSSWSRYRETAPAAGGGEAQPGQPGRRPQQNQTQFVRINNNPFTAEDNFYRNRGGGGGNFGGGGGGGNFGGGGGGNENRNQNQGGAEVIQRGGAGAWHGNAQILLKDEALNAGRRFADNKPPYQERQLSFDVGGPVLPGRLTTNFGINQNRAENVDTINATLPNGIFALGITKPSTFRGVNVRNTLQLSDRHSLSFNSGKRSNKNENQNVGGFTMPERASDNSGGNWNFEVKQFSAFSAQRIYETRFNYNTNHNETVPRTEGLRIDVTDAFSSGGAQNKSENKGWNYEFGNLYTQLGERLTIKTGIDGVYRKREQSQETNFTGTFKFSSLESFVAGQPISFRVNQGNPLLELGQWEVGFFFQNDFKLTPRFTLMTGARYSIQTNIGGDHNNLDPRIGLAYAVGRATVIRAGAGIFTGWIQDGLIADQWRQDGTRQVEIIIDNPSYPDPFRAGTVRNTAPSIRVIDPNLTQPYTSVAMVSYERTFLTNLFISAAYDFSRDIHRIRFRNLNAPRDITSAVPASCKLGQSSATCVRPDPSRGNIINLEASGSETFNTLRLNYRQRLSAFNVSAGYTMTVNWTDTIQNGGNGNNNVSQFGFSSEGLPSDSYNLRADWARGAQPLHNLNASVNYQLPLGLFLSGTVNSTSSRKYTVTTGTDDNQDTSVNDRPAGETRNGRPTPNFLNFDFNISKAFFFGAGTGGTRTNVNVFANMTNAFNRPNYGIPSGVMTSPNFQKSTNAGNPREIEVGLRFQF